METVPPTGSEALPSGTDLLGDQFTIERPLSNGGFGITYLANDNFLNRRVVIKECYPEVFCRREGRNVLVRSSQHQEKYRAIVQMFMREARAIAKLKHPNIVGVHRIFEDNETAYMVLDLIEGRDLLSVIKDTYDQVSPDQMKELLVKVLDAIDLVHQHDLLHRDISPDNILLDQWGNPILIDFGAARFIFGCEKTHLSKEVTEIQIAHNKSVILILLVFDHHRHRAVQNEVKLVTLLTFTQECRAIGVVPNLAKTEKFFDVRYGLQQLRSQHYRDPPFWLIGVG